MECGSPVWPWMKLSHTPTKRSSFLNNISQSKGHLVIEFDTFVRWTSLFCSKNQYCGDTLWPIPSITVTCLPKHKTDLYYMHRRLDILIQASVFTTLTFLTGILETAWAWHTHHLARPHKYFHDGFELQCTVTPRSILHITDNYS